MLSSNLTRVLVQSEIKIICRRRHRLACWTRHRRRFVEAPISVSDPSSGPPFGRPEKQIQPMDSSVSLATTALSIMEPRMAVVYLISVNVDNLEDAKFYSNQKVTRSCVASLHCRCNRSLHVAKLLEPTHIWKLKALMSFQDLGLGETVVSIEVEGPEPKSNLRKSTTDSRATVGGESPGKKFDQTTSFFDPRGIMSGEVGSRFSAIAPS